MGIKTISKGGGGPLRGLAGNLGRERVVLHVFIFCIHKNSKQGVSRIVQEPHQILVEMQSSWAIISGGGSWNLCRNHSYKEAAGCCCLFFL